MAPDKEKENAERADALTCISDNVSVPADDPKCPHPSSFCRFRELCEVVEAARKKKRAERAQPHNDPGT